MSYNLIPRRAALLGMLATTGCGFAPVYGGGDALRGKVDFDTNDNVAGFRMRTQLERRLGAPVSARYLLEVRQSAPSRPAAIRSSGDTVRFNLIGEARWTLRDAVTGKTIKAGNVEGFTSYSATGSTVATQAAETDAAARLSITLADMIVTRLLALSSDLPA